MVFWQEPPTTNWAQNARGLHHFSLEVLVYFLSFFHHFLWPCSLYGLGKGLWEGEDAQDYVNKMREGSFMRLAQHLEGISSISLNTLRIITKRELTMDGIYFLYQLLKNAEYELFELVIGQIGESTCWTLAGNHKNSIGC